MISVHSFSVIFKELTDFHLISTIIAIVTQTVYHCCNETFSLHLPLFIYTDQAIALSMNNHAYKYALDYH